MEYKIGDKVKLNDDPMYGSWCGVMAVIIGANKHYDELKYKLKRISDDATGNIGSHGFTKFTKEIKVFEDDE